jgi:hypothetical protein
MNIGATGRGAPRSLPRVNVAKSCPQNYRVRSWFVFAGQSLIATNPLKACRTVGISMRLKAKDEYRVIDRTKGLSSLGVENAIRLRWVLRDIRSNRLKWTPASPEDVRTLINMGYVEMKGDNPVVTALGLSEIDIGD